MFINAMQAREIMQEKLFTETLFINMMESIKKAAENNMSYVQVLIKGVDKTLLRNIINILTDMGYNYAFTEDRKVLFIDWDLKQKEGIQDV